MIGQYGAFAVALVGGFIFIASSAVLITGEMNVYYTRTHILNYLYYHYYCPSAIRDEWVELHIGYDPGGCGLEPVLLCGHCHADQELQGDLPSYPQ